MDYTVTRESFASLASYWADSKYQLRWEPLFVIPPWLEVWWQAFASASELYLGTVWQGNDILGIAPLMLRGNTAAFIGSVDVCDYLDFIVAPGRETEFFTALLADLKREGIAHLDLKSVHPDSVVINELIPLVRKWQYDAQCTQEDVSLEVELPPTWDEYLALLVTKQRHEIKRKLRRLEEAGKVGYRSVEDRSSARDMMGTFLSLFTESREEKADFLTAQMESYFRSLTEVMADAGLLRLGILELDTLPVAMVMAFDYHDHVYLYNSGYNPRYRSLSVGLLSKVLCIKDSIERGRKKFDFLKGGEAYKYHIGGTEIPLYDCQIKL
ncbi:MAG: GNAT family N-acetyltransferase [Chloroflexi bacterium]|nr:GNAT family N-acetyltransferase [Chloroflexota bacterium]